MPKSIIQLTAARNLIRQNKKARVIVVHPPHSSPNNMKYRIMYQLATHVIGMCGATGHKNQPDLMVLEASPDELGQIQELINFHTPRIWTAFEYTFRNYIALHGLEAREIA